MSRKARTISKTGIYHIMLRGADRRIIFADEEDCARFLKIIRRVKEAHDFSLYAYCLMGNHVHLLLQERKEPIEIIFKRIGVSYVFYYNQKYELRGHLFQDRFRSEAVETDAYFLDCLRYICQNPVKARMCKSPTEYPWLGLSKIMGDERILDDIKHLSGMSKKQIIHFINEPCGEAHLDDDDTKRLTDKEAIKKICDACKCRTVQEIGGWETKRRDAAIIHALQTGVSIRQLSRVTAISKSVIERVART